MELYILGSGTSGCVPNISCLIDERTSCKVCESALIPGSKNLRRNTSAVVRVPHPDGRKRNLLFDCGKSFYESSLQWFVQHKLCEIDAVILTHGHADAMLGLDDLRQWTMRNRSNNFLQKSVHIYLDKATMEVVTRCFPYMVNTEHATGSGEVAALQFHLIEEDEDGVLPFTIDGQEIIPFEVEHGVIANGDIYYALGFRVGDISYVSDTSKLTKKAEKVIKDSRIIVLDALKSTPHISHLSFEQCLDILKKYCRQGGLGLFTGMTHDVDHDEIEAWIDQNNKDGIVKVKCAYDGMKVVLK